MTFTDVQSVCIARQAYRIEREAVDESAAGGFRDSDFVSASASRPPESSRQVGSAIARVRPKTVDPPVAPLTNWYIGPRPLDPQQPLRIRPPIRERLRATTGPESASSTSASQIPEQIAETDLPYNGMEIVSAELPPLTLLAPPPSSPSRHNVLLEEFEVVVKPKKAKTPKGPKARMSTASLIDAASNGTSGKADCIDADFGSMPTKAGGLTRVRGTGRGRGRGRGRGAARSLEITHL